jgi:hypothetical protein
MQPMVALGDGPGQHSSSLPQDCESVLQAPQTPAVEQTSPPLQFPQEVPQLASEPQFWVPQLSGMHSH